MKKLIWGATMILGLIHVADSASASGSIHSAAECQPASAADAADLSYAQWGVTNNSTAVARTVICPAWPLSIGINPVTQYARMTGYDRNGLLLDNQDVNCSVLKLNHNGDIVGSWPIKTSGGGDNWGPQNLITNLGAHPGTGLNAPSFWQFQCSIPRKTSAPQFSWLTYYSIDTQ